MLISRAQSRMLGDVEIARGAGGVGEILIVAVGVVVLAMIEIAIIRVEEKLGPHWTAKRHGRNSHVAHGWQPREIGECSKW